MRDVFSSVNARSRQFLARLMLLLVTGLAVFLASISHTSANLGETIFTNGFGELIFSDSFETIPPPPPFLEALRVSAESPTAGTGDVLGFNGATNPGNTIEIRNLRTNQLITVPANGRGAFSGALTVQAADNLELRAMDAMGMFSPTIMKTVPGPNQAPVLGAVGDRFLDLGQVLLFTLSATDPDDTILTFSATPMPANASLNGQTGAFVFKPEAGQVGDIDVTFGVSDGTAADSEAITISVNLPPGGVTQLSGRVLDTNDFVDSGTETPVAGAVVSLLDVGATTTTDINGEFLLTGIPSGMQVFDIDPAGLAAPNGAAYAGFREALTIIDGVDNQTARPFYLPRIDMDSQTIVDPNSTTVVRNDTLGVRIEIPPNTAKAEDGSNYAGPMSISLVPDAVAPAALPPDLGFGLLITIQPVGVYFSAPVPIFFPNSDGLPEGSQVDIWSLDASIGQFAVVGTGLVDQNEIRTISGGVLAADWHGPLQQGTQEIREEDPDKCDYCAKLKAATGSQTLLGSGSLRVLHDLVPYKSLGSVRAPTLVYDSGHASAMAFVNASAVMPNPVPLKVGARIISNGASNPQPVFYDTSANAPGDRIMLSNRVDASGLATNIYPYDMDVTSVYSLSQVVTRRSGNFIVNNASMSEIGAGWSIAEVDRVVTSPDGGALLVGGDGSAIEYSPQFQGAGTFTGQQVLPGGPLPSDTLVADFNKDDWPDLVIASQGPEPNEEKVDIYINDQNGGFNYTSMEVDRRPTALASDDFNKDTNPDLVVAGFEFVEVFLGDGLGGFGAGTVIAAGNGTANNPGMVTGDFNSDTNPDVVYVSNRGDGTARLFFQYGDGMGGFGPQVEYLYPNGHVPIRMDVGLINNDVHLDLVVAQNLEQVITVMLGDGAGNFAETEIPLNHRPSDVKLVDINNDSLLDFATPIQTGTIEFFTNNGDGTFSGPNIAQIPGSSTEIAVGHFNGDSLPDLVVGDPQVGTITEFRGNGAGGFPVRIDYPVALMISAVSAGDFDRNGFDDLVIASKNNHQTVVLYNSGEGFQAAPVVNFGNATGPGEPVVVADFNEDRIPDVAVGKRNLVEVYLSSVSGLRSGMVTQVSLQFTNHLEHADFNLDGHLDLLVFTDEGNNDDIVVLPGDGLGNFPTQVRTEGIGRDPINFAVGDLNGDALPDVALLHRTPTSFNELNLRLLFGQGDGGFSIQPPLVLPQFPVDIEIADFNLDGRNDVLIQDNLEMISVYPGDGAGNLGAPIVSAAGDWANDVLVADLNGDAIPDLALTNGQGGANDKDLTIALGDGTGAFPTVTNYPVCPVRPATAFYPNAVHAGDLDGDGDLDLALVCETIDLVLTVINDGTGAFSVGAQHPTNQPANAALGDFNADGALDLATAGSFGLTVFEAQTTGEVTGLRSPNGDFSKLARNPDGSYSRELPSGAMIEFDTLGRQTSITDRNGNATQYQYDGAGLLTTIIDPTGRTTTLAYQGGRLDTITDPAGRVTNLDHDGDGNLVSITDPDSSVRQFQYDADHQMTKQISPRGFETRYDYDAAGVNFRTVRPDGSAVLVSPSAVAALPADASQGTLANPLPAVLRDEIVSTFTDALGNTTTWGANRFESGTAMTDALNRTTRILRNADNLPVKVTSPGGIVSMTSFDATGNVILQSDAVGLATERSRLTAYDTVSGNPSLSTDAEGNIMAFEYDAAGNLVRITDPLAGQRSYSYDARGLVLTRTDENTQTSTYTYDAHGNLETVTDPLGRITNMTRDGAGNITEMAFAFGTPDQVSWTFVYDAMNRLVSQTDAESGTETYTYDEAGNLVARQSPTGQTDIFDYDGLDRLTILSEAARGLSMITYDDNGNVVARTNPRGDVTRFEYDAADQLVKIIDGSGGEEIIGYDADGRVVQLVNGNGGQMGFAYDGLGRVVSITESGQGQTTFQYDARDLLTVATDADGHATTRQYDALSRLTEILTADDTVTYGYDATGNRVSVADGDSALGFTYDALNRITQASTEAAGVQPQGTINYTYDAVGDRIEIADSLGGTSTHGYDDTGRLTSVQTVTGETVTLAYDAAGRITGISHPNGVETTYGFNQSGQLVSVEHRLGVTVLDQTLLTRDLAGEVASLDSGSGAESVSYDGAGRIATFGNESYSYDAEGNRVDSHLSEAHQHDSDNRLQSDDDFNYVYDGHGRLIERTHTATAATELFDWDVAGRLTSYTDAGGLETNYRYDALGRRIEKSTGGTVTRFVYDGDNLRGQFDGAGALVSVYEYGPDIDQPLSLSTGGQRYAYHADHLGSVRALSNAAGGVANTYAYESFGRSTSTTEAVSNPFTYTGRERDSESGLYFYRNRYYDPVAGRFISPDPLGVLAGNSNLYTYVSNNALNQRDPLGLLTEEDASTAVDTLLILASLAAANNPVAGLAIDIAGLIKTGGFGDDGGLALLSFGGSRLATRAALSGPFALAVLAGTIGKVIIDAYGDSLIALEDAKNRAARNAGKRIRRVGDKNRMRAARANLKLLKALCKVQRNRQRILDRIESGEIWNSLKVENERLESNQNTRDRLLKARTDIRDNPADATEIIDNVAGLDFLIYN